MSVVDTLWIIDFSHSWISRTVVVVHVYSLEVRYEMIHRVVSPCVLYLWWSVASSVVVKKLDHFRIVSNTSFPVFISDDG